MNAAAMLALAYSAAISGIDAYVDRTAEEFAQTFDTNVLGTSLAMNR